MATYSRTLIEPLVAELAAVRAQLVSQAEAIGRLTAEKESLRTSQTKQGATLTASAVELAQEPPGSTQAQDPSNRSHPSPSARPGGGTG
jgi:hypothetical protein